MSGKKRQRPASAGSHHQANKKQQAKPTSVLSKTFDLWKILPNITQHEAVVQLPIGKKIKHSQVFIKITPKQRLELPIFLADLKRALELDNVSLHETFIELTAFTLLEGCVAITAILNYLRNVLIKPSNDIKYWEIDSTSLLRGSILVHKSVKVEQSDTVSDLLFRKAVKPKPFKCQLASVISIPQFKEVYLEADSLSDWMVGLLNSLANCRFRPIRGSVTDLLEKNITLDRQRLMSSMSELPFLKELFDPALLAMKNKHLIDADHKNLEAFMTELQEHNNRELTVTSKSSTDSKAKHGAAVSSTNLRSKAGTTASRYKAGNSVPNKINERRIQKNPAARVPQYPAVSAQDINRSCLAIIKASISKVAEKSSFQIIKSYVKFPKSQLDLIHDNLEHIKSKTNCNMVILNLQTVHESTTWFQQLPIDSKIDPSPSSTRVLSVGGVGGKCKLALQMVLALLETGRL
ncbi:unnamed protein product [Kluyveromyces dobzhanskii CBS 2104]|uniref:WGS project CCBQ000000000 data, contig 00041 n=1 Tax=Kluyveromyces dobzhanskii CBS 2104 TaxID=1427455 RepID=A0A0A8L2M6_9SACH|nr:unnamed protein product [Kluyveromyces dobzhanskii CBS 2104]